MIHIIFIISILYIIFKFFSLKTIGFLGLPKGSGKLRDISKFDAKFFGISDKEANLMDAQIRIMIELTYEAIWDAGKKILLSKVKLTSKSLFRFTIIYALSRTNGSLF